MYARLFRGRWHFWGPFGLIFGPIRATGFSLQNWLQLTRWSAGQLQHLLEQLAVEPANLPRIRNEGVVSLFGEFGLNLHGLVERARAGEFFDIGPGILKRFSGAVAIGGRNRLKADRRRVGR